MIITIWLWLYFLPKLCCFSWSQIILINQSRWCYYSLPKPCPTRCDPMDATCQTSLSFTISWSLLKLISIESVMPSNHLILYRPFLLLPAIFPSIRVFSMSRLFASGGQSIGASASASVLPITIQGWSPLGLTGLISLQSKGLSRVFSSTRNSQPPSAGLGLWLP